MLLDQVGKTDHHFLARHRRQARPDAGLEGGTGIGHGNLGIGQVATGDLYQRAPVHRADAREGRRGRRRAVFAMNKSTAFDLQGIGALFPVGTSQASHSGILYQ
jgi:hypothetical protein